jgi:APA family basic amino acid/polyamine antiporter
MARDRLFFTSVAALHPRYHTPARAIAIQATLASLLAILGTFDEILAYFILPTVLFLVLTVVAVFVLDRRSTDQERIPVPGHPWPALVFLVPTTVLLVFLAMDNPVRAGIGLGVVLLGIPVYHAVFTRTTAGGGPGHDSASATPPAPASVETI